MSLDCKKTFEFIAKQYDDSVIPTLSEYIKVPNLSPAYDKEIFTNGLQEKAMKIMTDWVQAQKVPGLTMEVVHEAGRTPVIFMELPATKQDAGTVLMYGHMDKQPPFTGWEPDLGPYKPVVKDNNGEPWLYGRGGADDGYAIFAAVSAVQVLQQQNIPHGRIVIIIEGSEESGSPDLPFYIDKLQSRIGHPNFIVCLDSGAGDYKRMWMTTSLRGVCVVDMKVSMLREGVHSGVGSGSFADSFRVCRMLLSRLEDEQTGKVLLKDFHCEIPAQRLKQTEAAAAILGDTLVSSFPRLEGVEPVEQNLTELLLNRTWRPAVTVTGAGSIPDIATAGNVLRPETSLRLSIRCPPRVDAKTAQLAAKKLLETNPPYNAKVEVKLGQAGAGWDAPALAPWLEEAARKASKSFFGHEAAYIGEGGSIPFMGMLGAKFPKAQFLITGVLGPASNAHGPNEGMNIPFTKKITASVVSILADHAQAKHE